MKIVNKDGQTFIYDDSDAEIEPDFDSLADFSETEVKDTTVGGIAENSLGSEDVLCVNSHNFVGKLKKFALVEDKLTGKTIVKVVFET